jgi:hypothetical protein
MTPWGRRARQFGRRGWSAAGRAGRNVQRLASQAPEKARKAGQLLASKVIGIQQSAGMEDTWKGRRLMQRSAESVAGQHDGHEPSADWQRGYAEVAAATLGSHPPYRSVIGRTLDAAAARVAAAPPVPEAMPGPGPEPAGHERPSWPFGPGVGLEPDGPEAGA